MDRYGSPRPTIFLAVAANFLVCRILEGVTNRRLARLPLSGADVFNVVLFSVRSFCSVGSGRYESGNLGVRYTEGGFRYCVLVAIPISCLYDGHGKLAVELVEEVAHDDLVICNGSNELSSIVWSDVVDRIGHLDVRAYQKVVAAMICWVFRVALCCDDLLFHYVCSKL